MQVDEAFKDFLRNQPFAVLCLDLDLGHGPEAVVLVKSSRDLVERLREAGAPVEFAWVVEQTEAGPVLCMVVRAGAAGVGELAGECYFDPAGAEDLSLLRHLAGQEHVTVSFLDQELEVAWFSKVAWSEVRRLEVEQVLDRAEEFLERTESWDGEEARRLFQESTPLDRLLERFYPPR